ncbi:MAG TPA: ROK family protein [Enterococcus sp.]|nr:ROK family protein [Enterococcus sp.]
MYIGIDIGRTQIKYALVDDAVQIFENSALHKPKDKGPFLEQVTAIIQAYQEKHDDILGVGISAPGIIQKDGMMTTAGAIRSLYGTNLKEEIEARTGMVTVIENDANAVAIAEKWVGNAQDLDNYLCIVLGTGVGGGIVINGEVFRGAHGLAGEFGWAITKELPEEGNIEYASLNLHISVIGGLCRLYNEALIKEQPEATSIWDAREILQRYTENEPIARQIVDCFHQDLAIGLMNLISQYDPEAILIGGGISANEQFFNGLKETLEKLETRHESINFIKQYGWAPILPAKLKNDAGIIGAVYPLHKKSQSS